MSGLSAGVVVAGCGAAAVAIHPAAAVTSASRYVDPGGWSLPYPGSMSLERSTSGPGLVTFTEVTVANFAQLRAVVGGRTRDGFHIGVRAPLDRAGRFPSDGVAFRMLLVDGGPAPIGTVADSRFPIRPSTFSRPQYDNFPPRYYKALGVPRELIRSIDTDGRHYQALVLIGPAASATQRSAIRSVIASVAFRRSVQPGSRAGEEAVVGPASRYPVGSFTLVHTQDGICDGSASSCRAEPFYLVHAPGQLRPARSDPAL